MLIISLNNVLLTLCNEAMNIELSRPPKTGSDASIMECSDKDDK